MGQVALVNYLISTTPEVDSTIFTSQGRILRLREGETLF
jgi:hypothetical protein